MDSQFDAVWANALHLLQPGTVVRNWNAARGYMGTTFNVVHIDRSSIFVSNGKMPTWTRISRDDFEKVVDVWEAYLAGNCSRSKLASLAHNTTYILSILNLLIGDQGQAS